MTCQGQTRSPTNPQGMVRWQKVVGHYKVLIQTLAGDHNFFLALGISWPMEFCVPCDMPILPHEFSSLWMFFCSQLLLPLFFCIFHCHLRTPRREDKPVMFAAKMPGFIRSLWSFRLGWPQAPHQTHQSIAVASTLISGSVCNEFHLPAFQKVVV